MKYFILLLCHLTLVRGDDVERNTVILKVKFRAYCPACNYFLSNPKSPLARVLNETGMSEILTLDLIPATGTMFFLGDGGLSFRCTGGEEECVAHRWLSCGIDLHPEILEQYKTINCLETHNEEVQIDDWAKKLDLCFSKEKKALMRTCFDDRSKELLKHIVVDKMKEVEKWQPYATINNKVLGTSKRSIQFGELVDAVCDAFVGDVDSLPHICSKKKGSTKKEQEDVVVKPCQVKSGTTYADPPGIGSLSRKQIFMKPQDLSPQNNSDIKIALSSLETLQFLGLGVLVALLYFLTQKRNRSSRSAMGR